jgi:dipeptidyl aminopeptidase B
MDCTHSYLAQRLSLGNRGVEIVPGYAVYTCEDRLQKGMGYHYSIHYRLTVIFPLQQWRHSSFGNYFIHNIDAKTTFPIIEPSQPPQTTFATWSPTGHSIAFVHANDLYILPNAQSSTSPIRVTTTGSETHFNGVPDWVYEEEVFSADYALWWSPDSQRIAFIESDETNVDVYTFPIYNPDSDAHAVHPYTENVAMRYPKPGYTNPTVDVHMFDLNGFLSGVDSGGLDRVEAHLSRLSWEPRRSSDDSIIMEVAWIGSDDLVVKEVNRAASDGVVVLFNATDVSVVSSEIRGTVIRRLGKDGEEGDDGWIDSVRGHTL